MSYSVLYPGSCAHCTQTQMNTSVIMLPRQKFIQTRAEPRHHRNLSRCQREVKDNPDNNINKKQCDAEDGDRGGKRDGVEDSIKETDFKNGCNLFVM